MVTMTQLSPYYQALAERLIESDGDYWFLADRLMAIEENDKIWKNRFMKENFPEGYHPPRVGLFDAIRLFPKEEVIPVINMNRELLEDELDDLTSDRAELLHRLQSLQPDQLWVVQGTIDIVAAQMKRVESRIAAYSAALDELAGKKSKRIDANAVRDRVDMYELVRRYAPGARIFGTGRITAKCPMHDDRLASFSADKVKKTWHCFAGCGGGDCFTLVMMMEKIDFPAAIKMLEAI